MRFSTLFAVSLLLLSPVAFLLSYLRQQPGPTASVPERLIQPHLEPSPDLSPSRTILPPQRNPFPREDYLPPPVVPSARSRSAQLSLPQGQATGLSGQVEGSLSPTNRAARIDDLASPQIPDPGVASLPRPALTVPPAPGSIMPPSIAVMTMTRPDLSAASAGAESPPDQIALAPTTLNNSTSAVFAQGGSSQLRQQLLIEPVGPAPSQRPRGRVVGAPAVTLSTPSGYGASFGQVFAGLSLVNRGRGNNQADGSATLGFDLGDPRRAVGLDVAVNVISLSDSNGRDSFAGSGSVGFKLHRVLPGEIAVAVGWENALAWGDARRADSSVYGVVSRAFPLQPNNYRNPMPLILSVGVGGGRFRSEQTILDRRGGVGMFASAGLQLSPQVSLLANWTGQDLNVGASFIPFPEVPFSLTLSAADLTGNAGDGARFALGLGYGTRFNF